MRLHRFYIPEKIVLGQDIILTDSELINQLSKVFRFQPGNQVILFDGGGVEYAAEIISLTKKEVSFKIFSSVNKNMETKKVSLYLSLIKKSNFELASEKCTEVGVFEIHPVISERSEKKDLNIERLNKIVKEASEQSGRVTVPKVFKITDLESAVSQVVKEGRVGVVFHTDLDSVEHNRPGHQNDHPALTKAGIDGRHEVATFVGPEGGWTEAEIQLFKENNFQFHSLGQNILRAETAAMIAVWKSLNI